MSPSKPLPARTLSLLVLLVMACQAWTKWQLGTLPELLWGCNVASLLIAFGLWAEEPRSVGLGLLWHLCVGDPAYWIGVLQQGHTGWSSVLAHSVPALAAFLYLRRRGLPRSAPWLAYLMFVVLVPLSFYATPAALNVNFTHHRLDLLLRWFRGNWDYRLAFSALLLVPLLLGDALMSRWIGRQGSRRTAPAIP